MELPRPIQVSPTKIQRAAVGQVNTWVQRKQNASVSLTTETAENNTWDYKIPGKNNSLPPK